MVQAVLSTYIQMKIEKTIMEIILGALNLMTRTIPQETSVKKALISAFFTSRGKD